MKSIRLIALFAAILLCRFSFAQTWALDKAHSRLGFTVTHLTVSEVTGDFKSFDIKVTSPKDDFSDAEVELTADINSVSTDNEKRDANIKGPGFFDAAKYGALTFKSTSFKKVGDKTYRLSGNLTMHGITKPVVLDVTLNGTTIHPYSKKTVAGFKVSGTFKRSDFGIGPDTPGAVLSDEVHLDSSVEIVKD